MDQWKEAKFPNYETNKDKFYPYSDIPFQKEYKLVKIPICVKNLIEHVDYFGLGRINFVEGTIGFPNCYNVNYEFRLVFEHPDEERGRKIPNRIPMSEGTSFGSSTRNYIKDNSVHTVTVNLKSETVTEIIAQDIARIVNSERGKVIVYGCNDVDDDDYEEIENLGDELKRMKQLFYCPIYTLPDNLRLTYWKTYRAFLGINELKRELYRNVNKGDIDAAVILTGCLSDTYCGGALAEVVNKLLANNVANVIEYVYKIWNSSNKEVVLEHFPSGFQHMLDGNCIAIIKNQSNQALVLEPITKARGEGHYKSSIKSGWKIIPIWDDNKVLFKLYNIDSEMYLQLSPTAGEDGDRQASGSKDSEELGDKFYFEPLILKNGQVAFNIFNNEDNKRLQLPVDVNTSELKAVVGHKSVDSDQDARSSWILTISSQEGKSDKKDEQAQSEDEDFSNIYDYD